MVMRKKTAAPGRLELVREFVNTYDVEDDVEGLASATALGAWLHEHGLASAGVRASRADLTRAIELREALRSILLAHNGTPAAAPAAAVLDASAIRARLQLRFDEQGHSWLEPEAGGIHGALGQLLVIVHTAIADGTWERLKACREHACEFAFYDHTKNRSGTWCNMEVCGNRAKARAYRQRRDLTKPAEAKA
jgi:predicted RNA-binding Zn ribbon-like protein